MAHSLARLIVDLQDLIAHLQSVGKLPDLKQITVIQMHVLLLFLLLLLLLLSYSMQVCVVQ